MLQGSQEDAAAQGGPHLGPCVGIEVHIGTIGGIEVHIGTIGRHKGYTVEGQPGWGGRGHPRDRGAEGRREEHLR